MSCQGGLELLATMVRREPHWWSRLRWRASSACEVSMTAQPVSGQENENKLRTCSCTRAELRKARVVLSNRSLSFDTAEYLGERGGQR